MRDLFCDVCIMRDRMDAVYLLLVLEVALTGQTPYTARVRCLACKGDFDPTIHAKNAANTGPHSTPHPCDSVLCIVNAMKLTHLLFRDVRVLKIEVVILQGVGHIGHPETDE